MKRNWKNNKKRSHVFDKGQKIELHEKLKRSTLKLKHRVIKWFTNSFVSFDKVTTLTRIKFLLLLIMNNYAHLTLS